MSDQGGVYDDCVAGLKSHLSSVCYAAQVWVQRSYLWCGLVQGKYDKYSIKVINCDDYVYSFDVEILMEVSLFCFTIHFESVHKAKWNGIIERKQLLWKSEMRNNKFSFQHNHNSIESIITWWCAKVINQLIIQIQQLDNIVSRSRSLIPPPPPIIEVFVNLKDFLFIHNHWLLLWYDFILAVCTSNASITLSCRAVSFAS